MAAATLVPISEEEAKKIEDEIESGKVDDAVETKPVSTDHVLRVHGIYMDKRREFEIRVGEGGRLDLWDKVTGKMWT